MIKTPTGFNLAALLAIETHNHYLLLSISAWHFCL